MPSTDQKDTSSVYDKNSQFACPAHANCFGTSSMSLVQRHRRCDGRTYRAETVEQRVDVSPCSWESRGDRMRGVSESGRECETTPLVLQQYASLFNTFNMRFDMTRSVQCSYTRLHNVTVMPNLSLTQRPPTLSSRDVRLENSTRLREREAGSN